MQHCDVSCASIFKLPKLAAAQQSRILASNEKRTIREVADTLIWADDRGSDWKNLVAKIPF
jgi:hypothetical protein